jgi:hypothetical protein
MFSEDDDTLGAMRLDELQQRRITGFDYDNVSMAFGPDKTLLVTITPNDTPGRQLDAAGRLGDGALRLGRALQRPVG